MNKNLSLAIEKAVEKIVRSSNETAQTAEEAAAVEPASGVVDDARLTSPVKR